MNNSQLTYLSISGACFFIAGFLSPNEAFSWVMALFGLISLLGITLHQD